MVVLQVLLCLVFMVMMVAVAVLVVAIVVSSSSCCCSCSCESSSSNRRNRLTNYPVLVPPRWPVFVVVVGLVLVPHGKDWIVTAPARCLLMVLVKGRASYRRYWSVMIGAYDDDGDDDDDDDGGMILGWPIGMEWNEKEGELFNDTRKEDSRERY
ncbi:hypothetical protein LOAG_14345 [Loa loa]|uniref:Uncharacterized protein n=2 Tax=Loa loa TaxID=7209 RepID=A0A1S0THX2_LOALO|nr:hypothetical protein LOAG_14345 [Loa loa]EFO14178.2 hypothetical protein LOAG_14345 [Loa loa]